MSSNATVKINQSESKRIRMEVKNEVVQMNAVKAADKALVKEQCRTARQGRRAGYAAARAARAA